MYRIPNSPWSRVGYVCFFAIVFAFAIEAKSQEASVPNVSGVALVRVSKVEKKKYVDLLPPELCDGLNDKDVLVVSLEITEFSGYVKRKIRVEIPAEKEGLAKKPLLDGDAFSVGEMYWIAFAKSFAPAPERPKSLSGVAKFWPVKKIDSDTRNWIQDAIDEDFFRFQPEYAPRLTNIGFGIYDPVSKADRRLPSTSYLNQLMLLLESQEKDYRKVNYPTFGDTMAGVMGPVTAKERERMRSVLKLHRKMEDTGQQQLKELLALKSKIEDEIHEQNEVVSEALLSDLSELKVEPLGSWQVQAMQQDKVLWQREIKGKSRAWGRLDVSLWGLPSHSHWIRFINNPQELESWLPKKLLESKLKFSPPKLNSLCALSSWEGQQYVKYYLDAETGNRWMVLTYETGASGFDSKLISIRDYSANDKLLRERRFIYSEHKDDPNAAQLETNFDPDGKISGTESSIIDSSTISSKSRPQY